MSTLANSFVRPVTHLLLKEEKEREEGGGKEKEKEKEEGRLTHAKFCEMFREPIEAIVRHHTLLFDRLSPIKEWDKSEPGFDFIYFYLCIWFLFGDYVSHFFFKIQPIFWSPS